MELRLEELEKGEPNIIGHRLVDGLGGALTGTATGVQFLVYGGAALGGLLGGGAALAIE